MLQQNFKTAAELSLPPATYEGAIKVLKMLERGEIKPEQFTMVVGHRVRQVNGELHNQSCIAGWVHQVTNKVPCGLPYSLVCPPDYQHDKYSLEQATHALRSYLVTGTPDWGLTDTNPQV